MRDGDPMQDSVQTPVAAAVEPVAHAPSRRGLQRGHAGIGGALGIRPESAPRTEDARECSCGQEADATQPGQQREVPDAVPKASPAPLPELAAYLSPFASLFRRAQSRQSLDRYVTGLLTDLQGLYRKNRRGGEVNGEFDEVT